MKTIYSLIAVSLMIAPSSFASEGWMTNVEEAKRKAAGENKGLLIEFTGSDWCGPCKHFKQTVLTQEEFLNEAGKGFVLVELDYPRKKEQSPEQKEHNRKYAVEYGVRSYPTVIFTNADGKPVHRLHVSRTLPNVLQAVDGANKDRLEVDNALDEIKKTTGKERIGLIKKVFNKVPFEFIDAFYMDLVNEVKDLPGDPTGYMAKFNEKKAADEYRDIVRAMPAGIKADREKTGAFLREEAGREGVDPMLKQRLLDHFADNLFEAMQIDEAINQYGAAIAASPATSYAADIKTKKERIEGNIDSLKLTADQINEFDRFEKGLDAGVANDPGKYAGALEAYLSDKTLTESAQERVIHPLVYAMIADGKTDEALARLQKAIEAMDAKSEVRRNMEMFRQMVDANRGTLEESLKKSWEKRASRK